MKKLFAVSFFFIISAVFCGCAINPHLETELPDTTVLDKSQLRVALYIPESTRNYTEGTHIKNACNFGVGFAPNRYGEIFAETVQGTLSQVFREVIPIRHPVEEGYDLIVQAEFTEFVYRFSCMADNVGYYILKGTFRALDYKGAEIWRSNLTEKKFDSSGVLFATYIPSIIASLVGSWTQELLTAPQIQQLSGSQSIRNEKNVHDLQ